LTPFATSDGRAERPERSAPGASSAPASVVLLLFAAAREAAGTNRVETSGASVEEVLEEARSHYGDHFSAVLERSRVWVNGEPVEPGHLLADGDEVAVLPPVSGG
jgi:MoaD family protein